MHPVIEQVTENIVLRSVIRRAEYLSRTHKKAV